MLDNHIIEDFYIIEQTVTNGQDDLWIVIIVMFEDSENTSNAIKFKDYINLSHEDRFKIWVETLNGIPSNGVSLSELIYKYKVAGYVLSQHEEEYIRLKLL
jgi:hypothetical protein